MQLSTFTFTQIKPYVQDRKIYNPIICIGFSRL